MKSEHREKINDAMEILILVRRDLLERRGNKKAAETLDDVVSKIEDLLWTS